MKFFSLELLQLWELSCSIMRWVICSPWCHTLVDLMTLQSLPQMDALVQATMTAPSALERRVLPLKPIVATAYWRFGDEVTHCKPQHAHTVARESPLFSP